MSKFTTEEIREFVDFLEEIGFSPESYSGRGMFGRYCLGICVSSLQAIQEIAAQWAEAGGKQLPRVSSDNMGIEYILYWEALPYSYDNEACRDTDESE